MPPFRRLRFGLATVLGLAPRGFFIPYRYAGTIAPPDARTPYDAIETLFAAAETGFAERLDGLAEYAQAFRALSDAPPPAPRWDQDWFPRLDAAMAYAMVRARAPGRIVEVGSGHSTRFLARAVADSGTAARLVAIDPAPRAALEGLDIEIIRKTVQAAGLAPFEALGPGDIMFIDSSHILMPGSDVDFLINRVMPGLPPGVRIHIHDVFLPDDYPKTWAWRGYNEQLAVAALLTGGYHPLFASRYAVTRMAEAVSRSAAAGLPLMDGALESGLWLEKQ